MIAESEDDEASELPQPVMSPEPRVDSTSSCQPLDTGTTIPSPGVSNMDQDATVPFGLGIEEMQLAGMLGQSGSKKGGGAQAKSFKFYSQKVKELKEIGIGLPVPRDLRMVVLVFYFGLEKGQKLVVVL